MTIEYSWKIVGVKTKEVGKFKDVICQVYWQKIGKDEEGNIGVFEGATPIQTESLENFIPYKKIKESTIIGWVQQIVVDQYEQHVNGKILKQIEQAKVKNVALPW